MDQFPGRSDGVSDVHLLMEFGVDSLAAPRSSVEREREREREREMGVGGEDGRQTQKERVGVGGLRGEREREIVGGMQRLGESLERVGGEGETLELERELEGGASKCMGEIGRESPRGWGEARIREGERDCLLYTSPSPRDFG